MIDKVVSVVAVVDGNVSFSIGDCQFVSEEIVFVVDDLTDSIEL